MRSTRTFVLAVKAGRSEPASPLRKAVSMRRSRADSAGSTVAARTGAAAHRSSAAAPNGPTRLIRCGMPMRS
ncbi:MAG: hypothetical protein DMF77_10725 [Acidobacteria bacterium]|nr:MAG: hypothetical protein DMF77_10725 [Acidobacteriota bacterium]